MLDAPIAGMVTLDGRSPEQHGYPAWRRRVVHVAQRAAFFGGAVIDELARPFAYRSAPAAARRCSLCSAPASLIRAGRPRVSPSCGGRMRLVAVVLDLVGSGGDRATVWLDEIDRRACGGCLLADGPPQPDVVEGLGALMLALRQ